MNNSAVVAVMATHGETAIASSNVVVRIANGFDRVVGFICNTMILVSSLTLLVLLGVNVVARYAFDEGGIEWISEMPAQLFPWLIAGGIVLAVQRGAHIAVDLLYSLLGKRGGRILAIAIHLLVAAAYTVLFFVVWDVAEIVSIERSPLLAISNSWGYYALMFGAGGTALCNLTILLRVLVLGSEALPQPNPEESPL